MARWQSAGEMARALQPSKRLRRASAIMGVWRIAPYRASASRASAMACLAASRRAGAQTLARASRRANYRVSVTA